MCCQLFGPPPGCRESVAVPLLNLSQGHGTLNDGIVGTGAGDTQLFFTRNDFVGNPIAPSITLHLGGLFLLKSIRVYGGDFLSLAPGALDRVSVEVAGHSLTLPAIPAGPQYSPFL